MAWRDEAGRDNLRRTAYQNDFCASNNKNNSNLLTVRKGLDNRCKSVYALNYREPSVEQSRNVNVDTYYRFENKARCKTSFGERVSVANCLVWHDARREKALHQQQQQQQQQQQTNSSINQSST